MLLQFPVKKVESLKTKLLYLVIGMSFLILTGCSSQDGKYEELMAKAEEAMSDFDIDTALKNYNKILDMDAEDLSYGETRLMIVQSLADKTEKLKSQVENLEKETENIKESYEKLDYSYKELDQLEEFHNQIKPLLKQLEQYPNTNLFKEIAKINKDFEKNFQSKVVKVLKKEIDKDINSGLLGDAQNKVDKLNRIEDHFSIKISGLDKYNEKLQTENDRYLSFPVKITKRNIALYENEDLGKVTFLGEGMKDGRLKAFYKFEGDLRTIADNVGLEVKYIFSDGNHEEKYDFTYNYYDNYVIAEQSVSKGESIFDSEPAVNEEDIMIERIDYQFNFMEEKKTITLKAVDKTMTIDAVMAHEEKSFTPNIVMEDQEKKVEISSVTLQKNKITLNGKITPKTDIEVGGHVTVSRPFVDEVKSRSFEKELFNGIANDFEISIGLEKPLHADEKVIHVNFLDLHANIDLNKGKESKGTNVKLADIVHKFEGPEIDAIKHYSKKDGFYQDAAGKSYINVIAMKKNQFYLRSEDPAKIIIPISKKYETLTLDVGVDKRYSGVGYGTSTLTFEDDKGNVLKEIKFDTSTDTVPVELNISNINRLTIKLQQEKGDNGQQTILLGNGLLK